MFFKKSIYDFLLVVKKPWLYCLIFEKIAFFCRVYAFSRQTNGRTDGQIDGQHQRVKPLFATVSGGLIYIEHCQDSLTWSQCER